MGSLILGGLALLFYPIMAIVGTVLGIVVAVIIVISLLKAIFNV